MKKIKKFNMQKMPSNCSFMWKPLIYALSYPTLWRRHLKLDKINMKDLKSPYLLLSNHHSFLDFKVMSKAIAPKTANYIVAVDAFEKYPEFLLRKVGGIPKRKFINDHTLIRKMRYVIEKLENILVLYPEARYSLDGTTAILPDSLGKVVKFLKVPVVVLNMRGPYLSQPQWNKIKRHVPIEATMTKILDFEQIESYSVDEINQLIMKNFAYNEYQYQKDRQIKIKAADRAFKLNKILFMCPHCHSEFNMLGDLNYLTCQKCQHQWFVDELNCLKSVSGETYFENIPDWFKWQREVIRQQIIDGTYHFEDEVRIDTLPGGKKYYQHGNGHLTHTLDGFTLTGNVYGNDVKIQWSPMENYGVHIEYDFRKIADAIDLSKTDDSYWLYPLTKKDVVTKISIATEEIYAHVKSQMTK